MKEITSGSFGATVLDYGIGATQSGDPQIMVQFGYKDQDEDQHKITWYGSLKEKAVPYTMKNLLTLGMRGSDIEALAEGVISKVLDTETPVEIVIGANEYNGKTTMRIEWINKLGGGGFKAKFTTSEAKIKLGSLNLKGALLAARAETGIKDAPKVEDDINF